jgi:hypothetical protein
MYITFLIIFILLVGWLFGLLLARSVGNGKTKVRSKSTYNSGNFCLTHGRDYISCHPLDDGCTVILWDPDVYGHRLDDRVLPPNWQGM